MKFSLSEESWTLDQLHPAEWHFLCELPELASGRGFDAAARKRLMPDPFRGAPEDSGGEDSFLEDWEEYVKPDIEATFKEAREIVEKDLDKVIISEPPFIMLPDDVDDDQREMLEEFLALTWRSLEISLDHVEAWYSTLNQARILMNEAHDLAEDEMRFMSAEVREGDEGIDSERAMLLTHYEFYSIVQSIMIDQLMEP